LKGWCQGQHSLVPVGISKCVQPPLSNAVSGNDRVQAESPEIPHGLWTRRFAPFGWMKPAHDGMRLHSGKAGLRMVRRSQNPSM
jgi:hypothetical protein